MASGKFLQRRLTKLRKEIQAVASTEDLLSTSGWRELLADFVVGQQTRLIAIKVMRVPGNPLIKGTFWLDDVKLTLAQTAAADH